MARCQILELRCDRPDSMGAVASRCVAAAVQGSKHSEGVSPSGAFEMAGKAWEWTADWCEAYGGSLYEPGRHGEQYRLLRGGSWFNGNDMVRTTSRESFDPSQGSSTIGLRCAE